ncbi:MAG: hypothetical protein KME17_08220 [Cyanosarcina radialis HA8281-LM2]|jgi:hypothetical protein|nr:hypothetical protein [Cyanosarcina radialis HA8281-LM2]
MKPKIKSLFQSKTFWSVVVACVAGLAKPIAEAIDSRKLSAMDVAAMVLVVTGTLGAVVGRVDATARIYTPDGVPGPNKRDLEQSLSSPPTLPPV